MLFSTVFQSYRTCPCFPGILLTVTPHNILSKPLAAFPHNQCQTMDSGERGMNPVPMTIINPQKEYWPSWGWNQQSPVLNSCVLPTELLPGTRLGQVQKKCCNQVVRILSRTFSSHKPFNHIIQCFNISNEEEL